MIFNHKNASLLIGFIKEPENALNMTLIFITKIRQIALSNCFGLLIQNLLGHLME